jgi:hypothetical protein
VQIVHRRMTELAMISIDPTDAHPNICPDGSRALKLVEPCSFKDGYQTAPLHSAIAGGQ